MDIREEIKKEMSSWIGLELTEDQITDIQENIDLSIGHVDTLEREDIMGYIGRKLTGLDWPCNGDGEIYKREFYQKLEEGAKKMGYNFKHLAK